MSSESEQGDADDAPLPSMRREEIILALLSTRTIRDAAKKAKIGERRMYRLLQDAEFQAAYTAARRAAFKGSVAQLAPLVEDAVNTLRKALNCKDNWPVRVRAAIALLDKGFAWITQQDFEDRLLGVERTLGIVKDERIAGEQGLHAVAPERLQALDEAERAELNELRRERLKASGRWAERAERADDAKPPAPPAAPPADARDARVADAPAANAAAGDAQPLFDEPTEGDARP